MRWVLLGTMVLAVLFLTACATHKGSGPVPDPGIQPESKQELGIWDGFRGLKWGADMQGLEGFSRHQRIENEGKSATYSRASEPMTLGAATLRGVHYVFYDGKLAMVNLIGEFGKSNFDTLTTILEYRYGKPNRNTTDQLFEAYHWTGKNVDGEGVELEVLREKATNVVGCTYTYMPLRHALDYDSDPIAQKVRMDLGPDAK